MLAHCVMAGMSVSDFYDAEIWEVNAILKVYFRKEEQIYQNSWELARFQLSGMVDTKNIKFPWERQVKKRRELNPEELEIALANQAIIDKRAMNEFKAVQLLIGMNYSKQIAREKVNKIATQTRSIIEVDELVNRAING